MRTSGTGSVPEARVKISSGGGFMGSRSAPSRKKQIEMALNSITKQGTSKHQAKQEYRAEARAKGEKVLTAKTKYVHSAKWYKNTLNAAERYIKFADENGFGHKYINSYNHQEAGKVFFKDLLNRGVKDIQGVASALRKFSDAVENRFGGEIRIVPDDLRGMINRARAAGQKIPVGKQERLDSREGYRVYSEEEMTKIMQHVWQQKNGDKYGVAIRGMSELGLREKECAKLQVRDIDFENGLIHVKYGAKGKRDRWVPVTKPYLLELKNICSNKGDKDLVFEVPGRKWENRCKNIWSSFEKACTVNGLGQHRVHNLRATWASKKYYEFREKGMDRDKARVKVSKILGHNRGEVLDWYIDYSKDK
ncbi:Phage integrase family protein [Desulfotomaculum arcticum]|uniref:Phage integrase family protein n=2 Tax=Desulfotruncus TaxID=2867377 RepID=A0A1I2ZWW7_9FIRM|nr:Phage integrase family protein [Desulfotomaculum arcticum] [Desulfotruncus arcticus DSM 17038]